MANTNNNKTLNVPNLRFPEFKGEWKKSTLKRYTKKITHKNKTNTITNVLCNSAALGIIPQNEYFDRDIANSDNTNSYYIIGNGDFVYNPRKSDTAPYGPINIYNGIEKGIISPLYLCFSVHDILPIFLYYRFKSSVWHSYIYTHGDTGVRFDRVSIKDDVFFNMPLSFPILQEQYKISHLLQIIDQRIVTQNKIIEKLQSLIKGINDHIQNLIDGESVCFSDLGESYSGLNGKAGNDFGSGKPFVTYMNVYQNTYVSNEEYGSVELSINERQNCVQYGDALFTLSSETPEEVGMGAIYLGSEQELYLNSFCFGVHFNDFDHIFPPYLAYLISSTSFRKSVYPLAQGSTRFNLQKNDFMKMRFIVPKLEIQKKIAKALDSLSNILIMEQQLYQLYTKQKQYLLQQMFI
jgi:type I restriction enzyme S subunit